MGERGKMMERKRKRKAETDEPDQERFGQREQGRESRARRMEGREKQRRQSGGREDRERDEQTYEEGSVEKKHDILHIQTKLQAWIHSSTLKCPNLKRKLQILLSY